MVSDESSSIQQSLIRYLRLLYYDMDWVTIETEAKPKGQGGVGEACYIKGGYRVS